jgi:hypothetical protein
MIPDTKSFSILSTRAPLVEVDGDGPYYALPGGVRVADGARTTERVDVLSAPVRCFRVEAPESVTTAIIVSDSPYGAFVQLRRCVEPDKEKKWWHSLAAERWPRFAGLLQRHARWLLAFWFLLTDDAEVCHWRDLGDACTNQVLARGGDVVIVSFINGEGDHA